MATVYMSEDQFERLLNAVKDNAGMTTVQGRAGNFSSCAARFSGDRDYEKVEGFINTIKIYKEVEKISDNDAIKGLPLLLINEASVWWQGVKSGVETWEEALKLIRNACAPAKHPHQVYTELFLEKQDNQINTDAFICKKRSLLAQLPDDRHDETTQLDLIYGLLNVRIRDKVSRDSVTTFADLLKKARDIEAIENELHAGTEQQTGVRSKKKRCRYCGFKGHTIDECRKKSSEEETTKHSNSTKMMKQEEPKTSGVSCYGCGTAGFYRSNCPKCKKERISSTRINASAIGPMIRIGRDPPTVYILVCGYSECAHIDTAARTSILGSKLYQHLLR